MPSEHDELLEEMRQFPSRLSRLVSGKSLERLRRAGPGGDWGPVEHLAHLRDFDEVTLQRMEQMLNGENPELEVFDTDVRAIELDYHGHDPFRALEDFTRLREELVDRLTPLPPEAWERTASHPLLGQVTLDELIHRLAAHGQEHYQALKDEGL